MAPARSSVASHTWSSCSNRPLRIIGHFSATRSRALMNACLAGVGIGVLARRLAVPLYEAGTLIPVLPKYRTRPYAVRIAFPASARRAPKTRLLLEALRSFSMG
ncbi:MAG: LysR substrate-binding domain-containing protein [Myxococcota bacterium]